MAEGNFAPRPIGDPSTKPASSAVVEIRRTELEGGKTIRIAITLEKQLTPVPEFTVDENSELGKLMKEAQALRELPDRERPRKVMELLRSRVDYSYQGTLARLDAEEPEKARAIRENNASIPMVNIEILGRAADLGYANCMPLSVAMLILGKAAGLEGTFMGNGPGFGKTGTADDPNPIINIKRPDTGEGLFKSDSNYGANIPAAHAWVEFKMSDGTWIPVDPSTKLVGDTPEGLQTFFDAHYSAAINTLLVKLPNGFVHSGMRDLEFLPGEAGHTGVLEMRSPTDESQPRESDPLQVNLSIHQPSGLLVGVPYAIAKAGIM